MRWLGLMCAILMTLIPTWGFSDRVTEAKLRFEQGAALISVSEVRKGLNELLISNRLAPNPNTLLNVARSLDYLKYYEYAYLVYEEYLRSRRISSQDRQEARAAFQRLEKRVARLYIESDPKGAEIYLNRETLGGYGTTPRRIAAKAGRHKIILRATNYQTRVIEIDLEKGLEKKLSVALEPLTGEIMLSTALWENVEKPPTLQVANENGQVLGYSEEHIQLPVGEQILTLNAEGFEPLDVTVDVLPIPPQAFESDLNDDEEQNTQIYGVELEPIKGSARILANQIGALIYLDGKQVGFTPQVIDASVGLHNLRLELTGFNAWEGELQVSEPPMQVVGEVEFRRPKQSRIHKAWPWALAGLAVVSAGLSATLAYEGVKTNERLPRYPTELDVTDGNRYLLLADGAGLVSVLSGVASYVLFRSRKASSADQPRARFYSTETPLEEIPPFEEMPQEVLEDEIEDNDEIEANDETAIDVSSADTSETQYAKSAAKEPHLSLLTIKK